MPTTTYTPIASQTLGSDSSGVTFSSIAGTYRDLILVIDAGCTATAELQCRLNNDSSSNYFWISAGTNGSLVLSQNSGGATNAMRFTERGTYSSGFRANHTIQFLDYAQSKHKTVLVRNSAAATGVSMLTNRWASTDAITTIYLYPNSGNFTSGSTFTLYGIAG